MTGLKFTSPSGETTIKVEGTGRLGTVTPKTQLHIKKMDEPVQYKTPMTKNEEEIEKVKAQIKVLEKKLSFLEELEKTKSPVEEAYKRVYGVYPMTDLGDGCWENFQAGYNAAYQEPKDNEWKLVALKLGENLSDNRPDGYYEFSPDEWFEWVIDECLTNEVNRLQKKGLNVVRESVKWCEEQPDKDPLDWLKPQTPEQVADGLKEAFREAVKQGVVSSVDKPETLRDVCMDWWDRVFGDTDDTETCIDNLVDEISLWLPKYQSAAGSQNAYVESSVEGFNDCLDKIKNKLR